MDTLCSTWQFGVFWCITGMLNYNVGLTNPFIFIGFLSLSPVSSVCWYLLLYRKMLVLGSDPIFPKGYLSSLQHSYLFGRKDFLRVVRTVIPSSYQVLQVCFRITRGELYDGFIFPFFSLFRDVHYNVGAFSYVHRNSCELKISSEKSLTRIFLLSCCPNLAAENRNINVKNQEDRHFLRQSYFLSLGHKMTYKKSKTNKPK